MATDTSFMILVIAGVKGIGKVILNYVLYVNVSVQKWCLHRQGLVEVFKDSLSIDQLLCHEPSGGEHGKTAVLEFLGLEKGKLFRIVGL